MNDLSVTRLTAWPSDGELQETAFEISSFISWPTPELCTVWKIVHSRTSCGTRVGEPRDESLPLAIAARSTPVASSKPP